MKKRALLSLLATYIIFLSITFFGSVATAGDWHELHAMSEPALVEKISEFKNKLNLKPDDGESLKALGIAYYIMSTKNPQVYVPLAYNTLSKANERNEVDYVTLCYLGSATTMMAMTTSDVSQM